MSRPVFRSVIVAAVLAATSLSIVLAADPASALTPPPMSHSHYLRSLSPTDGVANAAFMETLGNDDAVAHSREVVMDIGAQTVHSPLSPTNPGVLLTNTDIRLNYTRLVNALKHWMIGYDAATGDDLVTLAVATNSDGNFIDYSATSKGANWADLVIDPLRVYASQQHFNIAVVGANDIEAGFAANLGQVKSWLAAYLAHTTANLHYIGSADGCPNTSQVITGKTCNRGWTQQNYYDLTHKGSRVRVLPQIYVAGQASQWVNIDATGGKALIFAGSLSQHAACLLVGSGCTSFDSDTAWLALNTALARIGKMPGYVATDLDVDGGFLV